MIGHDVEMGPGPRLSKTDQAVEMNSRSGMAVSWSFDVEYLVEGWDQ